MTDWSQESGTAAWSKETQQEIADLEFLEQGDFEDPALWPIVEGLAEIQTSQVYAGLRAAKLRVDFGPPLVSAVLATTLFDLIPGETYVVVGAVNGDGTVLGPSPFCRLQVAYRDAEDPMDPIHQIALILKSQVSPGWNPGFPMGSFEAPSATVEFHLRTTQGGSFLGSLFWLVDEVSIIGPGVRELISEYAGDGAPAEAFTKEPESSSAWGAESPPPPAFQREQEAASSWSSDAGSASSFVKDVGVTPTWAPDPAPPPAFVRESDGSGPWPEDPDGSGSWSEE